MHSFCNLIFGRGPFGSHYPQKTTSVHMMPNVFFQFSMRLFLCAARPRRGRLRVKKADTVKCPPA